MNQYVAIIERAGRNWSAYVPDLPGCIAAGGSAAETEQLIREAIELHLETMREDGDPIPVPTTQAVMVAA